MNGRSFLRQADWSLGNYWWNVLRPWVTADWGEESAREAHFSWPQLFPWFFSTLHQLWEKIEKDFINSNCVSNGSENVCYLSNARALRIIFLVVKLNVTFSRSILIEILPSLSIILDPPTPTCLHCFLVVSCLCYQLSFILLILLYYVLFVFLFFLRI